LFFLLLQWKLSHKSNPPLSQILFFTIYFGINWINTYILTHFYTLSPPLLDESPIKVRVSYFVHCHILNAWGKNN
jgi:hypothetical protein